MKRSWVIILNLFVWTALAVYLAMAGRYSSSHRSEVVCSNLEVKVLDSARYGFITSDMVRLWFNSGEIQVFGKELARIDTRELQKFIARRGYVKSARVYTSMDGTLHVELTQRSPLARFNMAGGYNFYLTEDGYIVPAQRHAVDYVPLVTGSFEFPFAKDYIGYYYDSLSEEEKKVSKNYMFFSNLIKFVKFVDDSDFWNSFIVQINVAGGTAYDGYEPQLEIVPRIGNHLVILGGVNDCERKLEDLMAFYNGAAAYEGWNNYRYINLKYKGQIICIK